MNIEVGFTPFIHFNYRTPPYRPKTQLPVVRW